MANFQHQRTSSTSELARLLVAIVAPGHEAYENLCPGSQARKWERHGAVFFAIRCFPPLLPAMSQACLQLGTRSIIVCKFATRLSNLESTSRGVTSVSLGAGARPGSRRLRLRVSQPVDG
eukprot:745916-Hanusia_phi.AAC.1